MTPSDPRIYRRYSVRIPLELGAGGRLETLETEDVSQGGCRVVVMFPLRKGELVRVRLRTPQLGVEPSGAATVAWATREPPYRAGLQFSEALAAQMPSFLRTLLGPVPLLTRER
ncbi:MAG TPA: PilZ domain-containing protein [Anaeromyxobacter sp.]|nr:PilZ domain-containing protein [Anaeromyxobacter sp.]